MSKSKNMRDHASELADLLSPHLETAREKAGPVLADAREKAAPVLADARERSAPAINNARDKFHNDVLPVLTAAVVAAAEATEEVRDEAKKRGLATAAALRGEVDAPKESKHVFRKLLGFAGLAGIGALIAKSLSDRKATTAWQSSYQPTPAPAPTATAATTPPVTPATTSLDEAAASPDEAAADATEVPHPATTPDDPAEEIRITKD